MDGKPPTYDQLIDLTRRQARQIDELRAEVERIKAELEQSRRAGKRQAAPFSKGTPRADPKRPGRQAGDPPRHRPAPPPEQVEKRRRGTIGAHGYAVLRGTVHAELDRLSAGNRTEAGVETHAILASLPRTYRRQGRSILEGLTALLRHGPSHILEFDQIASLPPAR